MFNWTGQFPGISTRTKLGMMKQLCPDPNLILKIPLECFENERLIRRGDTDKNEDNNNNPQKNNDKNDNTDGAGDDNDRYEGRGRQGEEGE